MQRVQLLFAFILCISGCSTVKRLPPPDHFNHLGHISGMPDIRSWGDDGRPMTAEDARDLRQRITANPEHNPQSPFHLLAISGGGQNGAFGAGLLAGWTASGTRPKFAMVTGVSTGALMAPFAFLGPEYDPVIRAMYSTCSMEDVLKTRFLAGLFTADSIADNSPLRNILKSHFTPSEMNKVAQEYAKGRLLLVGTTNLDAQRPVFWDIGAIASSGHPDAYELIIDVLLASAAIPGVFPPVYIEVENGLQTYDEMHVDGGVTTQVFISPFSFNIEQALQQIGYEGEVHVYLIRNAKVAPREKQVKPKTVPILTQALTTLLRAQSQGDIYRIYQESQLHHLDYNAAFIPADFRDEPDELFNKAYMTELFDYAYRISARGYPWHKQPPNGND